MLRRHLSRSDLRFLAVFFLVVAFVSNGFSQGKKSKKSKERLPAGQATMWEPADASTLDLYWGPGGREMAPDLSKITFVKEEKGGYNKKYRIKDGQGRTWVAKLGREARPETAAVRLLFGLGYKTEINYLVPRLSIPTKGTFNNVRLELRPDNVDRIGEWSWKNNPFVESPEFKGLKIMQVFMTNWDVLDKQNEILKVDLPGGGVEYHYIVSDLGRTFGKFGNNNLPIIYRLGRRTGDPKSWNKASFIKGYDREDGEIKWGVKGKMRGIYKDITIADAAWLLGHMRKLSDKQISDIFRSAGYSPAEVGIYVGALKRRVSELSNLVTNDRMAGR